MNKHNVSLSRLCEIVDDKKHYKVLRFRTPKFIYSRFYDKLMIEFNEIFQGAEAALEMFDQILLIEIFNEAYNIIPIIIDAYRIGQPTDEMKIWVRDHYGFENQDIYKQIELLLNEQKHLVKRYEELKPKKDGKVQPPKYTFADIIAEVELNSQAIDRSTTSMYMFSAQYKAVANKNKQLNAQKDKI